MFGTGGQTMEVRPIDANALNFEKLQDTHGQAVPMSDYIAYLNGAIAAEELVKNAPTLDYEPVVHCKDCKYRYTHCDRLMCKRTADKIEYRGSTGYFGLIAVKENHFCSYGAKMDEEVFTNGKS